MKQTAANATAAATAQAQKLKEKLLHQKLWQKVLLAFVALIVVYILGVGLISSPSGDPFAPKAVSAKATDQEKALIMAKGVTHALDEQLSSFCGFLPNDLIAPWFIDNTTNYQKGVIFATRPASDMIAKTAARFGTRDTIDQRLADATSRYFSYSENVWGFLFVYDAEGKFKAGIKKWYEWAKDVNGTKDGAIYNVKSDDVYNIIKYCSAMTDYALGILNNNDGGHFKMDDNIYFAKGIISVTANVFRALIAVDSSVVNRGGKENVAEALRRFEYIEKFNPLYVMAGGNKIGDAMMPNHVAALARHLDIANNRLDDMLNSMTR